MAGMTSYFIDQYDTLYSLYVVLADMLGADTGIEFTINCTCYDESGYSISFAVTYLVEFASKSTLAVSDIWWTEGGRIDDFQIGGTVSSNYALERIECNCTATSDAVDATVNDTPDPYYFEGEVYSCELSGLRGYLVDQFENLNALYSIIADVIGSGDSLNMTVNVTCYDVSGEAVGFTIEYHVTAE